MRSDVATVAEYLAELPEERREAIGDAIARVPVDRFIRNYEATRAG